MVSANVPAEVFNYPVALFDSASQFIAFQRNGGTQGGIYSGGISGSSAVLFGSNSANGIIAAGNNVAIEAGAGSGWIAETNLMQFNNGVNGYLALLHASTGTVPTLVVEGATTQGSALQNWENGSAVVLDTISGSGSLGVGSSSPSGLLAVQGTSTAPTLSPLVVASSTGATDLIVLANGNVGIGTTTPINTLDVYGSGINNIFNVSSSSFASVLQVQTGDNVVIGQDASSTLTSTTVASTTPVLQLGPTAIPTSGGLRISGNGTYIGINTPSTFTGNILDVRQNSANEFTIGNTGTINIFNSATTAMSISNGTINAANGQMQLRGTVVSGATPGYALSFISNGAGNFTSGTGGLIQLQASTGYFPTSGNASYNTLAFNNTINQTGSANGISRGIFLQPILTSVYDYRNFETQSGQVVTLTGSTTPASTQYNVLLNPLIYGSSSTTFPTVASATTLSILGAPVGSATATLTNVYGEFLQGGAVSPTTTNAYGLFVAAPSGAANNYAAIFSGGNVGIGSSTPAALLSLQGTSGAITDLLNVASSTKSSLFIVKSSGSVGINTSSPTAELSIAGINNNPLLSISSTSGASLMWMGANGKIGIGTTTPSQLLQVGSNTSGGNMVVSNGWLCVGTGTSSGNGSCTTGPTTAGTIYANNLAIQQGDYAERYLSLNNNIATGTLVTADQNNTDYIAAATSTSSIMGVVSTAPGVVIGDSTTNNPPSGTASYPVALSGRVPVKVSNENGNINAGDYLAPSVQFPGYAMKATVSGQVIGQALQSFGSSTTSSTGSIDVFVQVGYQNINNTFVLGGNGGQITGQVGSLPSSSPASFLIDQRGNGNILQLQAMEQDRLLVASSGSVTILANISTSTASSTVLTVENGSSTLFSINSVGDASFVGHIIVGQDSAGTATIKAGDNQTTITFINPYPYVPKIVASINGLPDFFYGVATKTPTGFVIQTSKAMTQDTTFDWIALAQPQDTQSQSSVNLSVISSPSSSSNGGSSGNIPPSGSGSSSSTPDSSGQVAGDSTTTPSSGSSTTTPNAGSGSGSSGGTAASGSSDSSGSSSSDLGASSGSSDSGSGATDSGSSAPSAPVSDSGSAATNP